MTLFELIFIVLFLGTAIGCFFALFLRRIVPSRSILFGLASVWAVYLLILAVTDALSSPKVFKVGEQQCFDEMCFSVVDAKTMPPQTFHPSHNVTGAPYVITVRATSHSRGRAQAEGGLRARLYSGGKYLNVSDALQKAYEVQHGATSTLTQRIAPGESTLVVLVFAVPLDMAHPSLTLDHGFTPGYFVIGESPLFHEPDIHRLP